jgi:hypothetical protein
MSGQTYATKRLDAEKKRKMHCHRGRMHWRSRRVSHLACSVVCLWEQRECPTSQQEDQEDTLY